ncbi:hypothetical protein [Streptomyces griseofuscus]|uniref:hypothetical protein n=1 Tax=Streptomyces griseofuscus TaxID=146922 RepID=UPI003427B0E7
MRRTTPTTNTHYILENIAALAAMLYDRPWGLGFSDMCLLASDVPVVVRNRPDEDDQILAVARSDVMRELLKPGLPPHC